MKKIIFIMLCISFFIYSKAQWKLTGNSGTNPNKNWVGTNDDKPLNFRIDSEKAGTINKDKSNTAFGYLAFANGISNQSPGNFSNAAFGAWALQKNKSDDYNTAIGANALQNNVTGYGNVAVGFSALWLGSKGYGNTAIGYHSLDKNSSTYNTAVGFESMLYNKNGSENVAIGYLALEGKPGDLNDSLKVANTGCGDNTLQNIGNQQGNAALGIYALYGDTIFGTGNNNSSCGTRSLFMNYGDNNSALGYYAGYNNTSGTGNLFLGANADIVSGNAISGAAAIGVGAVVSASNKMQLGSSTTILTTSNGYTIVSDKRFKQDIEDKKVPGLNFINNLHPVTYTFNYKNFDDFLRKNNKNKITDENYQNQLLEKSKIHQTGFIAQEVDQLVKDSGFVFNGVYEPQNDNDNYALDYSRFVVPLVKAVQELSSQNDLKQQQIDSLKQSNQALNDKLNALSDKINQVENAMSQCCNSFSLNMQSYNSQAQSKTINTARLEQNVPNPFNNSSSISYYVPSGANNAQLMITDESGKTLKTYSITQSGSGKQIISGSELTSGMYQYSLLVDGKIIDTKKMVLSK